MCIYIYIYTYIEKSMRKFTRIVQRFKHNPAFPRSLFPLVYNFTHTHTHTKAKRALYPIIPLPPFFVFHSSGKLSSTRRLCPGNLANGHGIAVKTPANCFQSYGNSRANAAHSRNCELSVSNRPNWAGTDSIGNSCLTFSRVK